MDYVRIKFIDTTQPVYDDRLISYKKSAIGLTMVFKSAPSTEIFYPWHRVHSIETTKKADQ